MSVSLSKGQGVSLKKNEHDLSSVTIGLGWDINEEKKGLLGGLFGKKEEEYDLDVIAFLCNAAGKVTDLGKVENGKPTLVDGDIIFFNSLRHKSGDIWLTGDNRTGAGDGDDEQIIVKLNALDAKYEKKLSLSCRSITGKNCSSTSVKCRTRLSVPLMPVTLRWRALISPAGRTLLTSAPWCLPSWCVNRPAGS